MQAREFQSLLRPITDFIAGHEVDESLAQALTTAFPPEGALFNAVESACHSAIADGWMCSQGGEGRRFGRIIEPDEETGGLSVDVVDLENIVGPHHRHLTGEVCMIMPVTENALFDGRPRGWCVFGPGSEHRPTVVDGEALVLYMLPGGAIEFTGQ